MRSMYVRPEFLASKQFAFLVQLQLQNSRVVFQNCRAKQDIVSRIAAVFLRTPGPQNSPLHKLQRLDLTTNVMAQI